MLSQAELNPLIEAYRIREPLWNVTMTEYFDADTRKQLWDEMAIVLHLSVKEVQKRVRNLRTVYSRYRKLPASGSKGGKNAERRDWLLEKMNFCDKYIVPKDTQSNLECASTPEEAATQQESQEEKLDELETEIGRHTSTISSTLEPCPSTSGLQHSAPRPPTTAASAPGPPGRKRKREDPMLTSLSTITSAMSAFMNRPRTQEDSDSLFGKFVANELRSCQNDVIKSVVRGKITDALIELKGAVILGPSGDGPNSSR